MWCIPLHDRTSHASNPPRCLGGVNSLISSPVPLTTKSILSQSSGFWSRRSATVKRFQHTIWLLSVSVDTRNQPVPQSTAHTICGQALVIAVCLAPVLSHMHVASISLSTQTSLDLFTLGFQGTKEPKNQQISNPRKEPGKERKGKNKEKTEQGTDRKRKGQKQNDRTKQKTGSHARKAAPSTPNPKSHPSLSALPLKSTRKLLQYPALSCKPNGGFAASNLYARMMGLEGFVGHLRQFLSVA